MELKHTTILDIKFNVSCTFSHRRIRHSVLYIKEQLLQKQLFKIYYLVNDFGSMLNNKNYNLEDLGFSENEIENITKYIGDDSNWLKTDEHWKDMPEFQHGNEAPMRTIHVHFKTQEDIETFFKLVKQDFTDKTKFIWYPPIEKNVLKDRGYVEE